MFDLNHQPTIRLLDNAGEFIRMINQVEAFLLLRRDICKLLMIKPVSVQFKASKSEWRDSFLNAKKPSQKSFTFIRPRKSVLYGNFHIQSPEGQEMFHCSSRKALWYLNRDIVDIISDNTLRLKFKPNGMGHINDPYYLTEKKNECVVCGSTDLLSRHHVLPRVFRRHLSDEIKGHNYHDVLLLCVYCHEKYELEANKFKKKLCEDYGFEPTVNINSAEIGIVIRAASALLKFNDKIPDPNKLVLIDRIKKYLNKDQIALSDLKDITNIKIKIREDADYGKFIMEKVDLQDFVECWRTHFVETMSPKFLPEFWDIKKLFVRLKK